MSQPVRCRWICLLLSNVTILQSFSAASDADTDHKAVRGARGGDRGGRRGGRGGARGASRPGTREFDKHSADDTRKEHQKGNFGAKKTTFWKGTEQQTEEVAPAVAPAAVPEQKTRVVSAPAPVAAQAPKAPAPQVAPVAESKATTPAKAPAAAAGSWASLLYVYSLLTFY